MGYISKERDDMTTIESAYECMGSVFLNKVRKNYYVKENPLYTLGNNRSRSVKAVPYKGEYYH